MKKNFLKSFSYLETLMVIAFLGIVTASVLNLLGTSFFSAYQADKDLIANFLGLAYLENAKYIVYFNLASTTPSADSFWWLKNIPSNLPEITIPSDFRVNFQIATNSSATRTATFIVNINYLNKTTTLQQQVYCWHPLKCF